MPTVAEILERYGVKSEPSSNCAAGKIPFLRDSKKECQIPSHELSSEEEEKLREDLKTHLLQKGFGEVCTECTDRISSHGRVLFHFNKF